MSSNSTTCSACSPGCCGCRRPSSPTAMPCSWGSAPASLTRFCLKQLGMRCTAVELNPAVIQLCRQQFHLPHDHARLQVIHADAAALGGRCRAAPQREPAACRSVRRRSGRAGARQRRLLPRLPRGAGRRRRDEREPVRARSRLRPEPGAHRRSLRHRAGVRAAPHARGQHGGAGLARRRDARSGRADRTCRRRSNSASAHSACRRANGCACCARWRAPKPSKGPSDECHPTAASQRAPEPGRHAGRAAPRVDRQARLALAARLAARRRADLGAGQRAGGAALRRRRLEPACAGAPGRRRPGAQRHAKGPRHRSADRVAGAALRACRTCASTR